MIYLLVAFVLLLLTSLVPSFDTSSELFRTVFKRGDTYDTTYFALGNFIYYCLMNMTGYIYVNISNINMRRDSVFYSQRSESKDFMLNILFAPIFYFLGNNVSLRAATDIDHISTEEYTYWECIWYNYGVWTLAYLLGLQFTNFNRVRDLKDFSLSADFIARWTLKIWIFAIGLFIGFVALCSHIFYTWLSIGLLWI